MRYRGCGWASPTPPAGPTAAPPPPRPDLPSMAGPSPTTATDPPPTAAAPDPHSPRPPVIRPRVARVPGRLERRQLIPVDRPPALRLRVRLAAMAGPDLRVLARDRRDVPSVHPGPAPVQLRQQVAHHGHD